jgi:hypothetical protein
MRLAFGAWGIGGLAAARSPVWCRRFGRTTADSFSIPPMSSLHPGIIELFPFLLSECVFIDFKQYELLTSERGRALLATTGYHVDSTLGALLREFASANVLRPVDYSSIVSPHLDEVARLAEGMLDTPGLATVAAASRDLWRQFLSASGGEFLVHRAIELMQLVGKTDPEEYSGFIQVDPTFFGGREVLPKAALRCAHDVFDTTFMLKLGSLLGVQLCDWQMYRPIYRHRAEDRYPSRVWPENGAAASTRDRAPSIDPVTAWHIPTPRVPSVSTVCRMREDPYVTSLRNEVAEVAASRLIDGGDPGKLLELRKEIHGRVPGVILNTYAHYETTPNRIAFVEQLQHTDPTPSGGVARLSTPRPRAMAAGQQATNKSIFVSYAPVDNNSENPSERWLDRLLDHMRPISRQTRANIFTHQNIAPGEDHRARIQNEIQTASVAILLVSSSYLACEDAYTHEVPSLLWRRHNAHLNVIPLIVSPCLFEESFFMFPDPQTGPLSISLSAFQPVNSPSRPLTSLSRHEQDHALLTLAKHVHRVLQGTIE